MTMTFFICSLLLQKIYTSHRLVFKSHWKRFAMQGFAIIATAFIIFAKNYVGGTTLLCIMTEGLEHLIINWTLHGRFKEENLCTSLFDRYFRFNSSETGLITQLCIEMLTVLIPISVYLLT